MTGEKSQTDEVLASSTALESAQRGASTADTTTAQNDEPPHDEPRSERALRVSQLDADEMDSGLIHMLNAKISRALSVFGVSTKLQRVFDRH
jgi:hypothetical protein